MRAKAVALGAVAWLILGTPAIRSGIAQGNQCDRACLEGFVNQYLDALLAHDPFGLPWAPKVKFTENDQAVEIGEGLWATATSRSFSIFVGRCPVRLHPVHGQLSILSPSISND